MRRYRAEEISADDVYVWWGKVGSPHREGALPHLERINALGADVDTREDDVAFFDPDRRKHLTENKFWAEFDAEHAGIGAIERELRDNMLGEKAWNGNRGDGPGRGKNCRWGGRKSGATICVGVHTFSSFNFLRSGNVDSSRARFARTRPGSRTTRFSLSSSARSRSTILGVASAYFAASEGVS